MNRLRIRTFHAALTAIAASALLQSALPAPARAEVSGAAINDVTSYPVISTESATPIVMLAMSKDHQYFFKAYNDYNDVDGDGTLDTTYKHGHDYYGYFDANKCYDYDAGAGRFVPQAVSPDKYCDAVAGQWSGNFMNWATMTRMDVVRKLLYGGTRSADTSSLTVLERAYLPHDAHSFAKFYDGADIPKLTPFSGNFADPDVEDRGVTICNTTNAPTTDLSQTTTEPPLIRVAQGDYSLWSAQERWQCTWNDGGDEHGNNSNGNNRANSGLNAHSNDPSSSTDGLEVGGAGPDYVARIEVCSDPALVAASPVNNENCKIYPSGHHKPVGLLQRYGEDDLIHFGLMTGSYVKNISGGVLRKNVGSIVDEVHHDTDGTFRPVPAGGGVINTLDRLRMYGYRYSDGIYFNSGGDNCPWQLAGISEGSCTSWGNPLSEIYLESLRYLAGKNATPAFAADDSGKLAGLTTATWADPLTDENRCAPLNVIAFNASVSSYDDDQMGGIADLGATGGIDALTKAVGDGEGITGKSYFVGRNGTDNDEFCSAKTVDSLGSTLGLCPEAPTVLGSYHMAGAAHFARVNDIRGVLEGEQKVKTFAVALATNVPKIEVPVPGGQPVTILPAYRLTSEDGGGALVDFKVIDPHAETSSGSGIYRARFYINWEDSEQGGDFDQDMWGILEYELDTTVSPPTIEVTTDAMSESTGGAQLFGFVVSGTTQDGFHAYSGIEGANFGTGTPRVDATGVKGCENCRPSASGGGAGSGQFGPQSHTFTTGAASAGLLENPLYYAAKWGGFTDENSSATPDLTTEWDQRDMDGNLVPGGDGLPDNYFFVTDPAALEKSLTLVFEAIIERTAAGTAAAVVANTQTGDGAAFQALYEPAKKDPSNNEVKWIGTLHALWIDQFGLMREDNPGSAPNGKLDGYNTDPVVEVYFDEVDSVTRIRRYTSSSSNEYKPSGSSELPLRELSPIWNAREQLSSVVDVTLQRLYATPAETGRHVLTWLDGDRDGVVDDGEQVAFEKPTFDGSNYGHLDVPDLATGLLLVDYVRGLELPGHRNRTVDFDGDGTTEVMRLGDIIHSTPTPVHAPSEALDLLYGDVSYAKFRAQYAQRRQVVYVGANDGMLHAFNGGFYNAKDRTFDLSRAAASHESGAPTAHPLGAELWSYVPRNLLPHLKWLKDPAGYTHVYYVDGKPRTFDARVFAPDTTHPEGWGTVLVVGMRLGGGTVTVDTAGDGLDGGPDDTTMRSAYVVLDVTDPEKPPRVLAEIAHPDLAYTTSYPTPVFVQGAGAPGTGAWYLVFGTGPDDLSTVTSAQTGKLIVYDLENLGDAASGGFVIAISLDAASFVGDALVADWDLDRKADTIYVGLAGGTAAAPTGKLFAIDTKEKSDPAQWDAPRQLLDTSQPILTRPTATNDEQSRRWVYASTGRFLVNPDRSSVPPQTLYGIIDGAPNSFPLSGAGLVNVTNARVYTSGKVENVSDSAGDPVTTFTGLVTAVEEAGGWKLQYENDGTNPSQRGVTNSSLIGGILFNAAFTPSTDLCGAEGKSVLYGLFYKTGTAIASVPTFGTEPVPGSEDEESLSRVNLGAGLASSPSLHPGKGLGVDAITVVEQTSVGAIVLQNAQTSSGVLSAEIDWREYPEQ